MIWGIGIDIVKISRLQKWLNHPKLLERIFHSAEIDHALTIYNFHASQPDDEAFGEARHTAAQYFAARYAAKEAFGKALGIGIGGLIPRDIETRNGTHGKPQLFLHQSAQKSIAHIEHAAIHISLSHEKELAIAMVTIEGDTIG